MYMIQHSKQNTTGGIPIVKKLLSLLVTIAMLASITTVSLAEDLPELTYLRWDSDPYTEEE